MKEIRRYLDVARGQLDLIENSFQLIADNIVTMQSPQELSGQLNELLDGVESIRQTAAESETLTHAERWRERQAAAMSEAETASLPGPTISAAATCAARRRCSSSTATCSTPSSTSSGR